MLLLVANEEPLGPDLANRDSPPRIQPVLRSPAASPLIEIWMPFLTRPLPDSLRLRR